MVPKPLLPPSQKPTCWTISWAYSLSTHTQIYYCKSHFNINFPSKPQSLNFPSCFLSWDFQVTILYAYLYHSSMILYMSPISFTSN
jgi:hypothetical protein